MESFFYWFEKRQFLLKIGFLKSFFGFSDFSEFSDMPLTLHRFKTQLPATLFIRILSTAMAFCHKRLPRFFSPWIQQYFQTHIFKDHKTSFCVDDIPQKHHLIVSNLFNFQLCNLYAVGFPAISVSKFYY